MIMQMRVLVLVGLWRLLRSGGAQMTTRCMQRGQILVLLLLLVLWLLVVRVLVVVVMLVMVLMEVVRLRRCRVIVGFTV